MILNLEELNILGFVREWPFNITGVTQIDTQTYSFDCNAVGSALAPSRGALHLGISAVNHGILLNKKSGNISSAQCRRVSNV